MNALIWKHGTTPEDARRQMVERLETAGVSDKVSWKGNRFSASIGWGTILHLVGEIQSQIIVLERCSGAIGTIVLEKCRDAFREMFPAGEEIQPTDDVAGQQIVR